jgi:hypothetical protein
MTTPSSTPSCTVAIQPDARPPARQPRSYPQPPDTHDVPAQAVAPAAQEAGGR